MRYILELYLTGNYAEDFTDSTFFTLCQFAIKREMSTYQVFNELKKTKYKIEYKNIHKKIQKFLLLKLIKKTSKRDLKHASIYYELSDTGVFYILLNIHKNISKFEDKQLNEIFTGMIHNHGDNDFFFVFIYPYFNKSTILNIRSKITIEDILNYCSLCCNKVLIKLFGVYYFAKFFAPINWNDIVGYIREGSSKDKIGKWLVSLRVRFQDILDKDLRDYLNWLDEKAELKFVDENTIMIKSNENKLFLKIDRYEKKAFLIHNKKILLKYDIVSEDNDYKINILDEKEHFEKLIRYQITEYSIFRIFDFEKTVLLPFILRGRFKDTDERYWNQIVDDVGLLINDDKFYESIIETDKNFSRFYDNVLQFRNH